MKHGLACAVLAGSASLFCIPVPATPLPPELHPALPVATLSGQARMRFWGFEVYQASLWVAPGFVDTSYEHSAFALELTYLRDFTRRSPPGNIRCARCSRM